jgi:hypothetical protein
MKLPLSVDVEIDHRSQLMLPNPLPPPPLADPAQDSLGGDSKVLMFVCVSPAESDASESLCSLNFAGRVRNVELGPAKRKAETAGAAGAGKALEQAREQARKAQEEADRREARIRQLEAELQQQAGAGSRPAPPLPRFGADASEALPKFSRSSRFSLFMCSFCYLCAARALFTPARLTAFPAASAAAAAKADLEKKLALASKASADAQALNPRMDRWGGEHEHAYPFIIQTFLGPKMTFCLTSLTARPLMRACL